MKTINYKLLIVIVLLIPFGLVLKKIINPSGTANFDLDKYNESVIILKPDSDLVLINDRRVENLEDFFTDIQYYRIPNPSLAITPLESANQCRLLHHSITDGHISLSKQYDELSIIQVNESGETDHLLNLSKVDSWSVEDVDFLPFQVLQDGRILLGNTSSQLIHILDLKSNKVERKDVGLFFTDFAYFEKEDVYVLYSPMPFSDPNAPEELGYDIYFLDGEMNVTHSIQPSEATHPLLEVGSDRGFSIPEFTNDYIFWMQYTEGEVFKIYPNGEVALFIQIEQSHENSLAIERVIENSNARLTGTLPIRSYNENVLKYIPFNDIHFIEDAVLFSAYQGGKPIFIYCDLKHPEKLFAFSKCISLQDFGDRFDFAFVYPNFDVSDGYFNVVFDKRSLDIILEHIDDRYIKHLDGLISPESQLLLKYKLDHAYLKEYADSYHR